MELISRNISKTYDIKERMFKKRTLVVLDNVNFSIKQGEVVALIGKERSGKSTLVNVLSGRDSVSNGVVLIDNEEDNDRLVRSSVVIRDIYGCKLLSNETVFNNLVNVGHKLKLNNLDVEKRIVDLKNILGFEKVINQKVSELDKVNLAKVNLAVYLFNNISLLFIDGAFSELDVMVKTIILKDLKRINKELKTTIVIASNNVMDIEKICKRVIILKDGEVEEDLSFDIFKDKYLKNKLVSIIFNKSFNTPKGDFEIVESNEYSLSVKIDFGKCDFASLINQFDINTIVDISISTLGV